MRLFVTFAIALGLGASLGTATAQPAAPTTAGGLAHAVDRLASTGRVLYVAAHPDDENTRLLAYLANIRHLEVAYLAMTRGGGGQNLIGGELDSMLDVIRTEELLAARRIDGARQLFTRMRDFGYSKSADETIARWGHDDALADVVRAIRAFQPDVIVTRFSERPPNHGHHTASAILAREAFAAAADPSKFPEQLREGLTAWQATRIVYNVAQRDGTPPPAGALRLDIGAYDPRLGLAMGELAAHSRSQHKSQGFGVPGQRGAVLESFVPIAGSAPTRDLLDGVELGWQRYGARAAGYLRAITEAQRTLDRDHPERALPALVRAHAALAALPDDPRVREARAALGEVIAAAAGVFARATASAPTGVPGSPVAVDLELVARTAAVSVQRVELAGAAPLTTPTPLALNDRRKLPLAVSLPASAPPSVPSWLAEPGTPGRYEVADPRRIGLPRDPAPLVAAIDLAIPGGTGARGAPAATIRIHRAVVFASVDPVQGEREQPFVITPPATLSPLRAAVMATSGRGAPLDLRVRAARDGVSGRVSLALPPGWTATPAQHPVTLAKAGDEASVRFEVRAAPGAAIGFATPIIQVGDAGWSLRADPIAYPHIPTQLVLRPASVRLVPLDLRRPAGRIAYVRGSGDSIASDLAHVGFAVDELDDTALRGASLDGYAAVILGIRAYNARPAVRRAHARLMAYVARGGTLIAQYNTLELDGPVGPHELALSRDRITDETAAPTFLAPQHPLLARPNRITAADFAGWIQERGLYFANKWDKHYTPLVRFTDPGEAPLDGALVVAPHGKGRFIYTGLSLFRQLPVGVPGAYRLLANLIGGGK